MAHIFLTGGTGYMGRRLIPRLAARGHHVRALVRQRSTGKLPSGCEPVIGDPLDRATFGAYVAPADTFVQLVGTPHPNPRKAKEFQEIDLVSARESVASARDARVGHFVYVSVAHPAPVMEAYIAARSAGEQAIADAGLRATVLRPWYVLGPRHWWPVTLLPVYALLGAIPATRASAHRLGLVTLTQMLRALVFAVEHPPERGIRVVDVPAIRRTPPS